MPLRFRFILVLLLAWFVQGAVIAALPLGSAKPDLILIVVCVFGLSSGSEPGSIGGFAGGFLQDMLGIGVIGVNALGKSLIGYASGRVDKAYLGDSIVIPIVFISMMTAASQVIDILVMLILGETLEIAGYFPKTVLPSFAYTVILAAILYPLLIKAFGPDQVAAGNVKNSYSGANWKK